ncbi:MAG TPA: helix-turn-helix domain-containing protein [Candidatus Baltobacteraceae bacterium]
MDGKGKTGTYLMSIALTRMRCPMYDADMADKRRYSMAGRAATAQATRERIRTAAAELYRERSIADFTLDDVARRAGTTVKTVLRAFGSKEDLVMAALTTLARSGIPTKPAVPGDVAAAVREIFDIYETVGDLVIARLSDERRLPALKASLDEGRAGHREWVARAFEPFIQADAGLLEMLDVITDVYVWKLLRRDRQLERAAAESIMLAMLRAVLGGARRG